MAYRVEITHRQPKHQAMVQVYLVLADNEQTAKDQARFEFTRGLEQYEQTILAVRAIQDDDVVFQLGTYRAEALR
jgi:hypothetical protein